MRPRINTGFLRGGKVRGRESRDYSQFLLRDLNEERFPAQKGRPLKGIPHATHPICSVWVSEEFPGGEGTTFPCFLQRGVMEPRCIRLSCSDAVPGTG